MPTNEQSPSSTRNLSEKRKEQKKYLNQVQKQILLQNRRGTMDPDTLVMREGNHVQKKLP